MLVKGICIEEPGQVVYKELPMPKRKQGEALLKLLYGGICGSDLGTYRGTFAYAGYPRIPGHEFSAEIVEIEDNALGLEPGMVVTANPYFNCGTCYSCQRGLVNCCEHNQTMGAQRDGAFCQYITMPIQRLYEGRGISAKHLALVEPFCIGYHGMKKAAIKKKEKVLVIGAGTIGTTAAIWAKHMGAEVHICDRSAEKLDYARGFSFDQYLLSDKELPRNAETLTRGKGYDVVAEAVGLPETFQSAIDLAAYGGRVIQIGVGKESLSFDFTVLQKKELSVYGARNAVKEDFLAVIEEFRNRTIPFEKLITHVFPFEEGGQAFEAFDKSTGNMLKALIEF
jgi:2-desacetyl-2-hydroxyethyl bacteriochlorophyllide A dehydrogenase